MSIEYVATTTEVIDTADSFTNELSATPSTPDENPVVPSKKSPDYHLFYRQVDIKGCRHDAILWAYNTNTTPLPPAILAHDLDSLPEEYEPADVSRLNWAKDEQPHIPFVPTNSCFSGPIFRRLSVTFNNVPIVLHHGRHCLEGQLAESWKRLEIGLTNVANKLLAGFLFTLNSWRQSPSNYGYLRTHSTEKRARRSAIQSREGFRELMGLCSYGIAMRGDQWRDFLIKKDPRFHPDWLDKLNDALCQNQPIGALVDISKCFVTRHIWKLRERCPWWFLGALILPSKKLQVFEPESPHIRLFRPSSDQLLQFATEMKATENWISTQDLEESENVLWNDSGDVSLRHDIVVPGIPLSAIPMAHPLILTGAASLELCFYPATSNRNLRLQSQQITDLSSDFQSLPSRPAFLLHVPDPHPGTGQRKGETWREFFNRRDATNARLLGLESSEERLGRQRRLQTYESGLVPAAMKVYEWVDTGGFLLREHIPSSYARTIWSVYPPSECLYDPFTNQLDFCKALSFQPSDEPIYIDDEDGDFGEGMFVDGGIKTLLLSGDPLSESLMIEDLEHIYQPSLVPTQYEAKKLIEDMYSRYGFISPASTPSSLPSPSLDWKTTQVALGHASGDHSSVNTVVQSSIRVFVSYLVNYGQSLQIPPTSMWDLSAACHLHPNLRNSDLTYRYEDFKTIRPPPAITTTSTSLYILTPRQSPDISHKIIIAIPDPLTVLQCLRMGWGPGTHDVISRLVHQGSPFYLLRPPDQSSTPVPVHYMMTNGLGFRPQTFHPTLLDYVIYEEKRDLVLTPAATCAAIRRGGIVWRLVLEKSSSKAEIVDALFQPPEYLLSTFGLRIHGCGQDYVDYDLSDEDERIICGAYCVSTGSGDATVDKSWWPKSSTWDKGTMNAGYWTPDCEDWFQERLRSIKTNTAKLRTTQEWKSALKMQRKGRVLHANNSDLAREFLNGRHF